MSLNAALSLTVVAAAVAFAVAPQSVVSLDHRASEPGPGSIRARQVSLATPGKLGLNRAIRVQAWGFAAGERVSVRLSDQQLSLPVHAADATGTVEFSYVPPAKPGRARLIIQGAAGNVPGSDGASSGSISVVVPRFAILQLGTG